MITETQDTSDGGMVYSAVVRQDGKKTTVKTTAVLDGSHQQQPDTSNEGLVYSAVVVKLTWYKDYCENNILPASLKYSIPMEYIHATGLVKLLCD